MNIHTEVNKILVPVPLNSDFAIPLKQAVHFHKVYGSKIILMNVVPHVSIFHKMLRSEKIKQHNRKALKKLKKLTQKFFGNEMPDYVKIQVANGELISTILKMAVRVKSDLIIIKKAGRIKGIFRFLKKENADRLIGEAVCPVLTITNNITEYGIRNIMVPVDITKKSSNKVAWAISLAKKFNSKINIVSVQNIDVKPLHSLSYKKSLKIEETIRNEGLEVSTAILKANKKPVEDVILSHAESIKPDILLIMTHQETILFDNYLGNFASKLIHKSLFPVFSVVPRQETIIDVYSKFYDGKSRSLTA